MVLFSVSGLKDEKLIKKQTYIKTMKTKTANSIFQSHLNIFAKCHENRSIIIFSSYRFKVGAFFSETQCTFPYIGFFFPTAIAWHGTIKL